ncbi:MAG: hypothetical protein H2057_04600 [Alphaproteobacteria bacterium]|nr:hypothetical protein [Alphaproteobacteria bacterium]
MKNLLIYSAVLWCLSPGIGIASDGTDEKEKPPVGTTPVESKTDSDPSKTPSTTPQLPASGESHSVPSGGDEAGAALKTSIPPSHQVESSSGFSPSSSTLVPPTEGESQLSVPRVAKKGGAVPKVLWSYGDSSLRGLWNATMKPEIERAKFTNITLGDVSKWIKDHSLSGLAYSEWLGLTFPNLTGLRGSPEYYYGECMIFGIDYGRLVHTKESAGNTAFKTTYIPVFYDVDPATFVSELVEQQRNSSSEFIFLKETPEKKQTHQTLTSTTYELYTNDPNRYFKIMVVRYGNEVEPITPKALSELRINAQGVLDLPSARWKE